MDQEHSHNLQSMGCLELDEMQTSAAPVEPGVNLAWMKLAIAVAIIRTKPPGKCGKEYAESLRAQYFSTQAKLEEMLNSTNNFAKMASTSSLTTMPFSQDSDANQSNLVSPSSYLGFHQMSVESARFSRSLIALQNLSTRNCSSDATSVHNEAISHLRCMHDVLEQGLICVPEGCLNQAAHVIAFIMATQEQTDEHLPQKEKSSFVQEVCRLVDLIIAMLALQPTDQGQYPPHRQKHSLIRMLLTFIQHGSQPLALSIVDQLTESLETFSTALRDTITTGKLVDSASLENSFFIIHCMELTLEMWQRDCPAHPAHLQELQTRLDTCLLSLTDKFPLIAQAVWKLTSLIETLLQNRWS